MKDELIKKSFWITKGQAKKVEKLSSKHKSESAFMRVVISRIEEPTAKKNGNK